jgi:tRNA modification GTPase
VPSRFKHGFCAQLVMMCYEQPNTFTGEDMVELHVHGSVAVIARLMSVLPNIEGIREAKPGEFTKARNPH